MTDLDKLIAAVEDGDEYIERDVQDAFGGYRRSPVSMDVHRAYNGSLDAAKALHDALLPGWRVHDFSQYSTFWAIVLNGDAPPHFFHGEANTPARAWLLAILRAYRAQQGADHG